MSQSRNWKRRLLIGLLAVLAIGVTWIFLPEPDPLFRGRPESEWIKEVAKDPNDQTAALAVMILGQMRDQPELVVPALVECVESPSSLVASQSVQMLGLFPDQHEVIVPALERAAQRNDSAGAQARRALDQLAARTSTRAAQTYEVRP